MGIVDIGFVIERNRALLRRLLRIVTEHVTDDARQRLAEKVVAHLELSGLRSTKTSNS